MGEDHHHKNDQDTLLTLLRNCANAPPAGVYDSLSRDQWKSLRILCYGKRMKS